MNTALNRSVVLVLTNKSGGDLPVGAVVVLDLSNDEAFTTTTVANYINTFPGVITEPNGIANNAAGTVSFGGYVPQINLTAAGSRGDKISTGSVAGQGVASAVQTQGTFAVLLSNGASPKAVIVGLNANAANSVDAAEGRLTLQSGVPFPTGTLIVTGSLYYTPTVGNSISLYSTGSAAWLGVTFTEQIISTVGLSTGTNYDVFAYLSGTSGVLFETLAWTNDLTRATAVVRSSGRYIKSGATEKRYIGSFRTDAAGVLIDSVAKRFVWNANNRVERLLYRIDTTENWVAAGGWRQANASVDNKVEVIIGLAEEPVELTVGALFGGGAINNGMGVAIGEDTVTAPTMSTQIGSYLIYMASITTQTYSHYKKVSQPGYHYYAWLEYGNGGTFYSYTNGAVGNPDYRAGMLGHVYA